MTKQHIAQATLAVATVALTQAGAAEAQPTVQTQASESAATMAQSTTDAARSTSLYDRIWGYAIWYNNEENPVIQKFQFTGRYQLDYAWVGGGDEDYDDWDTRRWRMGGKATLFHDFTVHGEVDLDPESDPVYQRLTDAYVAWSRNQSLKVTAGKQSTPFTLDGSTSSKELLTLDRSNLANNLWFTEEYIPGVSASGKPAQWRYFLGVYSAGTADEEFGNFDGGWFVLSTIGYDFAKELEVKKALLNLNYVYNEGNNPDNFTRPFEHTGSLNFDFDAGKWGFRADLAGGTGQGAQSDVWGAMAMPYYSITAKLQVVARYTYLQSDQDNGVRLARYENQVVSGRGDLYQEFYL